eukprot:TRINITY_DN16941_c0_g1_i4.p1 TRINITY_DN16941_c0_g1~~TRINITY_DN16941_c0_g1_i4.p1  ORF type:complete len:248 (-),score=56.49 TRINITY_DN16941_c0_g1_i4:160-903(-)
MAKHECNACRELERLIQENQRVKSTLLSNLVALKEKIINSSKVLTAFNETEEENRQLKEENERLRREFVEYKSATSVPLQVAQYRQAKLQVDQLAHECNTAKYTEEQLVASTQYAKKAKEENEALKQVLESKEKSIKEFRRLLADKNKKLQEYMERGVDKINLLKAEIEVLKKRNEEGMHAESIPIEHNLDDYVDNKIEEIINRALPDIVKSVGELYKLRPKQIVPSENDALNGRNEAMLDIKMDDV